MQSKHIQLINCDESILNCLLMGDEFIEQHMGWKVAPEWSTFGPQVFEYALRKITNQANAQKWWTYLPIHIKDNTLIGNCGFKGFPNEEGIVEIGYEVAATYQNRGYATEITGLLLDIAWQDPKVKAVRAHTLAEKNASCRVLEKCNFKFQGVIQDPELGEIWEWQIPRP